MSMLELDSVTKTFQDGDEEIVAVNDISMSINDGEFLVVVGPSGCGKSTTLRMIAGLEAITSGTITLADRVINDVPSQERDIAMVFQSYALYPHMTVRENMSFGLEESTDLPGDEIDQMVSETADLLDIPSLLDRKPSDLSGGQQQRVALGRAIVRDPEVFLMDEPLSNLDAKLRAQMRTELQRLQNDLGVTTVYVTHDQTEAMTMGDRIAILDSGELQQVATPIECYHEPCNRFVASFLGEPSMNFFDVRLNGNRLIGDLFEYSVGAEIRADVGDARDIALGIRPESIELVDHPAGDHDFETTVDVVEPMGDENTVHLRFDPDADPESAVTLVATIDGFNRVSEGDTVLARIPEEAIHLFDRDTGEALHNRSMEDAAQQINLG
jgi:multiple sugar transport system ATP-binding protein